MLTPSACSHDRLIFQASSRPLGARNPSALCTLLTENVQAALNLHQIKNLLQKAECQQSKTVSDCTESAYVVSCRIAYALSRSQLCPCPVPSSVCSLLGCQGSLPLRLSYSLSPSLSDRRMPSRFSSSSPAALPSDSLARFGGACSSALHVPSLAASHSLRLFLSLSLLSSRSVVGVSCRWLYCTSVGVSCHFRFKAVFAQNQPDSRIFLFKSKS